MAVWELITAVERMGEWSPEATGGRWLDGGPQRGVGSRFRGSNAHGPARWSTTCEVTKWVPGVCFAFSVRGGGQAVSEWEYCFEATEGGCVVTESWTDRRNPFLKLFGVITLGIADRAEHNRRGMEATLKAVCAAAEA